MSSSPELVQPARALSRARSRPASTSKPKQMKTLTVIEISDSESDKEVEDGPRAATAQPAAGPSRTRVLEQERPQAAFLQQRKLSDENVTLSNPGKAKRNPIELFLPRDEENEPPCRTSNSIPFVDVDLEDTQNEVINVDLVGSPPASPTENVTPEDPTSTYLIQVLEIVPDVQPDYATTLINQHLPERGGSVAEFVLHHLFENSDYPKVDRKGKRKATTELTKPEVKKAREDLIDYGSVDRDFKGGVHYVNLAIDQLMLDFPEIPKPYIRKTLVSKKSLYAPTYFLLETDRKSGNPLPYVPKKITHRRATAKGKGIAHVDSELETEREWLVQKLAGDIAGSDGQLAQQLNQQEYEENGDGIECGCCFSTYPFDKMVQCEDGHLFCTDCMTSYSENLLGSHNVSIVCMDQSGCKLPFPVSELRRFLPDKLMELYERVKQAKEIEMAGLEGLEECPFCEYKCVIENPDEKLFRCGNAEDCGAITCRQCKKPDHLPKSCQEMEDDRRLDGRHAIEEAMTRALMRNCPKCGKGFIKEDGCNKMTCPNCHSLSCYVCRKLIPEGYIHFNQAHPHAPASSGQSKKCPLWDGPVEARHAKEIQEAAQQAKDAYLADNPDVEDKEIHVDVPKAPPPVQRPQIPPALVPNPRFLYHNHHHHHLAHVNAFHGGLEAYIPPPPLAHPVPRIRPLEIPPLPPVPALPHLPQLHVPPQPRVARAPRRRRR
ncbi:hypothetical protein AAF712_001402 [Marasmius tenuissimus]|uniref:RING-type domain-containing protein n=1 Tax=Marasmius tenuissimus TaxID=585030 RepID=A0ABR3ADH1_9AGAR